jgi:hypothetical protein
MVTTFPAHILGIKVEILVNLTWTDVSTYVYQRDSIQISGVGRADEQGNISASQVTLTFNNQDGRFSPLNNLGAYYPYITRNTQIRISINAESANLTTYSGYRFWGEISEWPLSVDASQHDIFATITASGIWRRLSQYQVSIGSPYTRYHSIYLTGSSVPQGYWTMEDGSGSTAFVAALPGESNGVFTVATPSFGASSTFPGTDAICQLNGAVCTFTVPSGGTATNNVTRYLLAVPAGGDTASGTSNWNLSETDSAGTVAKLEVYLNYNGTLTIDGRNSGGTIVFTSTGTFNYQGSSIIVSVELTPSGGNIAWALRTVIVGTAAYKEQLTGTLTSATIGAVSKVVISRAGALFSTAVGHLMVNYQVPSMLTEEYPLNGYIGEYAMDRFTRLCTEQGIGYETIGTNTTTAKMGPQVDDTITNILQSVESTDCGLLSESRDQFGLTYRSLVSMQSQTAALIASYTAATLAGSLTPIYDDQWARNNVSVSNYDGYTVQAILSVGIMSVQAPPNGLGPGYVYSRAVNAQLDSQISGIANWLLTVGTVSQERYPTVTFDLSRSEVVSLFSSVPSMRIGDYLQITTPPSFFVPTTIQQLVFGWTETINAFNWTITFNTVPEIPYSAGYSPGTVVSNQVTGSPVSGNTSAGASVIEGLIQNAILNSGMLGQAITSLSPDSQLVTISTTGPTSPNNGDIWINSTTGLISQWESGAWVPTTFNATDVIQVGTITSALIQANTIVASNIAANTITAANLISGIVVATIVDGTVITGAQLVANDTTGDVLVYAGPPSVGNMIGSWSANAGNDAAIAGGGGNNYPQGLMVGPPTSSNVTIIPNSSQPFNVTTAISGIITAMAQFTSGDASEVFPGLIGALNLGNGTAIKETLAISSPFANTSGAAILLESENDAGTDLPIVTFGTTISPDANTIVFSPLLTLTPYAFILYSGPGSQVIVTHTSGSGTITVIGGATVAKGESWGASGGSGGGASSGGGQGSGGGEYAREPNLAIGGTVAYSVGAAGTAGGAGATGGNGGNSTLTGTSVTVTAHGGSGGQGNGNSGGGQGGTGSSNTATAHGGAGGYSPSSSYGGGGGGSSGGPFGPGFNGSNASSNIGGSGGSAVPSGGAGGKGGSAGGSTGWTGSTPGGGSGGAGSGSSIVGHAGLLGQVRLTYLTSSPAVGYSVNYGSSFVDQYGNTIPPGYATGGTGVSGSIPVVQTDTTIYTVTATPYAQLCNAWPLAAYDAKAGTAYRLTVSGAGTQGTTSETLSFRLSAFGVPFGAFAIGGTEFPANQAFEFTMICMVVCLSTVAAKGAITGHVGEATAATNQLSVGGTANASGAFGGWTGSTTINAANATVIELQAGFASNSVGCTIASGFSIFERLGP